jgi:hypothetical protein
VLRGGFAVLDKTSDAVAVHSGGSGFMAGVTSASTNSAVFLQQPGISIAPGATVIFSAWIKLLRNPPALGSGTSMSVQLYLDSSIQVADAQPITLTRDVWVKVTSAPFTVSGDAPHTFQVYFGSYGVAGPVIAVDDVTVVATSGPANQPLCPGATN